MLHVDNKNESELGTVERRPKTVKYGTHEIQQITEEELRLYKKCSNESLIKVGVPFAVLVDIANNFIKKKQGEVTPHETTSPLVKSSIAKRGMMFIASVIFGSFLYTPVCLKKFKEFHDANEKRRLTQESQTAINFEGSSVKTQPDDFSYPTDHVMNLNESDSSFSTDFTSSSFIMEEEIKPKVSHTTYDDLRARNRESSNQAKKPLHSIESNPRLTTPVEPVTSEPPPRRVKRNKYGDEME